MKKKLAFLLALVLCLPLCACGSKAEAGAATEAVETTEPTETASVNAEELLASAEEVDGYTLFQEYQSNKVKMANQYEGKTCLVHGIIDGIENDYIIVADSGLKIHVYLPVEDIINLEKDQYVDIVGVLENIRFEQNLSLVWVVGDFRTGCVSKDTYSYTGVYRPYTATDGDHPADVCVECVNASGNIYYVQLVLTDEQKSNLTSGQTITVDGRLFKNDSKKPYHAPLKLFVDNAA